MGATRTINTKLTKKKSGSEQEDLSVGHLTSIGEIGIESEEIDVTDLDSTGDFKEYIAGTKDAGEVSIAGNIHDEAIIEKMMALANSRSIEDQTVEYPSGAKWSFKGFVKSFKDGEKTPDAIATFSATIRISGAPTYTKATD